MTATGEWIEHRVRGRGNEPLLRHSTGRHESGRDVWTRVEAVRDRLAAFGVEAGDVVALRGMARGPLLDCILALLSMDAIAWPLSWRLPDVALDELVHGSEARAVIERTPDRIRSNAGGWLVDDAAAAGTRLSTSGSMGTPRTVAHGLAPHIASAEQAVEATRFDPGRHWLLSLPLFHVGGLGIVFRALVSGGVIVLPRDGEDPGDALARLRPTHVSLVATQLARWLERPTVLEALRAARCVLLGGGPIPRALRLQALAADVPIAVSYGSTESTALVSFTRDPHLVRQDACAGRLLDPSAVSVADDGEILLDGPTLFDGYVERTTRHDRQMSMPQPAPRPFATRDVGRLDGTVLHVLGRKDRQFVSGGENVQPEEIETALERMALVDRAIVVPVPHPEFGERPVAFLDVPDDRPVDGRTLDAALRERLPGFKVPDRFHRLPRSERLEPKPRYARLAHLAADPDAAGLAPL